MATNDFRKKQILNQFQDNEYGNITAENCRNFINSIFDTTEVIVKKFETLDAFEAAPDTEKQYIYEGSLVAITNDLPAVTGIYVSLTNQPKVRNQLQLIANLVPNVENYTLVKTNYEVVAFDGQYFFHVEYWNNLVDVYVNGEKIRDSQVILDNNGTGAGTTVTLKNPVIANDLVEIVAYKRG
jgi:hypothetical protein